jgi:hypothetical protein
MKKLLFTFLLLPALSFGRGLELGINFGYNTMIFAGDKSAFPATTPSTKMAKGLFGSVKLMGNITEHVQLGLGVDIGSLKQPTNILIPLPKGQYYSSKDLRIAKPYIQPSLYGNFILATKKIRPYVGANLGVMIAKGEYYKIESKTTAINSNPKFSSNVTQNIATVIEMTEIGFGVGVQAGVNADIAKGISFNVETAPRAINFNGSYLIPVSVGLRFRF